MKTEIRVCRVVCGPVQTNTYLLSRPGKKEAVVIDPADGQAVLNALEKEGLTCERILLTHGHFDHIGGVEALRERFGCPAAVGAADAEMLEGIGITMSNEGNEVQPGKRMVWVRDGNKLSPKQITVGTSSTAVTEVAAGLQEGEEIAVDMAAAMDMPAMPQGNQNPFMPGPPGRNNKKNGQGPKE